jgi:glycosyltransferase involved in cell wall biosynthesis
VQVLLATYNGERFLREQIDSILAQTLPGVSILARDDGSQDGTVDILREYAQRFPERFQIVPTGSPAGSAKGNFLALMQESTAAYVAFADQDDVWMPEKLELQMAAIRSLERQYGAESPLLVFCNLRVVDDQLALLAPSFWALRNLEPRNIFRLERLLMENVVTGCTALINAPLVRLARSMPEDVPMHDWWVALLACVFGHAAILRRPLLLYRQHANNVIGALRSAPEEGFDRLRQYDKTRARWDASVVQAGELLRIYPEILPEKAKATLQALLGCNSSSSRVRRLVALVRRRFFIRKLSANLATAWYLWDKESAGRL